MQRFMDMGAYVYLDTGAFIKDMVILHMEHVQHGIRCCGIIERNMAFCAC
jgi:hypothetical protein